MAARKLLLIAVLAAEGLLLLQPNGALVRAARGHRSEPAEQAAYWWRKSRVHMGCSIPSCGRPATRTASYQLPGARGSTWRAYGFCERHDPPAQVDGLVYRQGRPASLDYDVPLGPVWAETYFLLGTLGFGLWCGGMWRLVTRSRGRLLVAGAVGAHLAILAGLWIY